MNCRSIDDWKQWRFWSLKLTGENAKLRCSKGLNKSAYPWCGWLQEPCLHGTSRGNSVCSSNLQHLGQQLQRTLWRLHQPTSSEGGVAKMASQTGFFSEADPKKRIFAGFQSAPVEQRGQMCLWAPLRLCFALPDRPTPNGLFFFLLRGERFCFSPELFTSLLTQSGPGIAPIQWKTEKE